MVILISYQRYQSKCHNIFQIITGFLLGLILSIYTYNYTLKML